ncbi:kinesin family protein [Aspergillus candidus]|uniref:Kinesin family protein n=1 Tax=Aspergillus candidus TaxID=41067 RepID=A0A2I2FBN3_ASPCN|nr:kinesin family protein [Aspergillus candidus]PLB38038.1 kinesin family protein [Aspergillus candidus]
MTPSPPGSPTGASPRPLSALMRTPRSTSRLSMSSKQGSRASDEDSKTAVKVAVRVRPPLKPDDPGYELVPQRFQRSMVHVTAATSLAVDVPQGRKLFVFDRVFPETVNQDGVWEYLCESVHSFLQGYNVSILAYGQSGAGKSYTMGTSGPSEQGDPQSRGIIPRAAQLLFDRLEPPKQNRNSSSGLRTPARYSVGSAASLNRASVDKSWQMKATYVEIYNEQLRDLLLPDSVPQSDRGSVSIREDTKGRILLTGLHQVTINSIDDLMGALSFGSSIRQTDSTAINAKSSRSHAVFSLNLVQRKPAGAGAAGTTPRDKRMSMPIDGASGAPDAATVTVESKLHFVDLAGSERLKNTGASGERAREGISINAGLAALGKVISQLSSRQAGAHVSYRDSKLTRLLQDSLGGNAYTYMIACVTPAEFHLSETLNTVQYAQRARAIQSKPRIQQVADEGDKHALIERLKAEVSFLRQQLRRAEASPDRRRGDGPAPERPERANDREIGLQNQLLDVQESYNALSQRHARLMAELARGSEGEKTRSADAAAADPAHDVGRSSVERLQRSHSFAESVEQVVLEYEKTIQSLESSLSDTRASLSQTESTLLERETTCAYVEALNTQLQARVQKFHDRESGTESYLHELESKLEGHSSGEERHAAIVAELRKELTRARDSEAHCEDYISTLEERLAEADQDMELLQREVDRLEHVVDRQRSLGKLDSLLYELDHVQNAAPEGRAASPEARTIPPVRATATGPPTRNRAPSLEVLTEAVETAIPDSDEGLVDPIPATIEEEAEETAAAVPAAVVPTTDDDDLQVLERATSRLASSPPPADRMALSAPKPPSPTPSGVVADKLETVSRELLDLRLQHETTLTDYELLEAKYEDALKTMAALRQDAADEARHAAAPGPDPVSPATTTATPPPPATTASSRPVSFLEEPGAPGDSQSGTRRSFSQSLSSELSLAGEPAPSRDSSSDGQTEPTEVTGTSTRGLAGGDDPDALARMRKLLGEHEEGLGLMAQRYAALQAEHEDTLSLIESLKTELQRPKSTSPPTTPGFKTPMIRRKTSTSLISTVDRAHRSLTSMRAIATEEFGDRPDARQNFEVHLDAAMHELQSRVERIQSLEAENQSVRKEMEMKSTIISGLTRERTSLQAGGSSVDPTFLAQLRDQIVQQETLITQMTEAHAAREQQLRDEITQLQSLLQTQEAAARSHDVGAEEQDRKIGGLEGELAEWQGKHADAVRSLEASERQLSGTLQDLDRALADVDALRGDRTAAGDELAGKEAAARELDEERRGQEARVAELQLTITTLTAQVTARDESHEAAQRELADLRAAQGDQTAAAGDASQSRITELEREIEAQRSASDDAHRTELASLQESHRQELVELETRTQAAAQAKHEAQLSEKDAAHDEALQALRSEIAASRAELAKLLGMVGGLLNADVTADNLADQLQDIVAQKQRFSDQYAEMLEINDDLRQQLAARGEDADRLDALTQSNADKEAKVTELALLVATLEDTLRQKDDQVKKKETLLEAATTEKDKSARLVEELEDQITNSFDQHHNRLSLIQQEREQALIQANAKIGTYEKEIETYRVRIEQLELQIKNTAPDVSHDRSSSLTSNLRKSSSAASLPSPPPAIPLPPLPTIAAGTNGSSSVSPPSSRHASKEIVNVNSQLVEDQEARIRTMEKHLHAEKQLTATLEEALGDLEAQSNKVKSDSEAWKKKAWQLEDELSTLRKERNSQRLSLQAVEEERSARREAEAARAQLEERMNALNKKKKKSTLNCF